MSEQIVKHVRLGDILCATGWNPSGDAQWKRLEQVMPDIAALFAGDALHAETDAWKSTAWERLKHVQTLHAEAEALRKRARTAEREASQALRTLKGLKKVAKVVDANSDQVCGENNLLRQEVEALRAELSRRNALDADGLEFRKELIQQRDDARTELEAARGLLRELIGAVRSMNCSPRHVVMIKGDDEPCFWQRREWVEYVLGLCTEAEAALTATPAPEVKQCAHEWVDARNSRVKSGELCIKCNAIRPGNEPEQGERQEAVSTDALRKRFSEIEDEVARGKHSAMSCFTAMRTAALYIPQSGPDVRALVEALEHAYWFIHNGIQLGFIDMPDDDVPSMAHDALPMIEKALAPYSQAQQEGERG